MSKEARQFFHLKQYIYLEIDHLKTSSLGKVSCGDNMHEGCTESLKHCGMNKQMAGSIAVHNV
jgi:hypothetical protein